jgi:hypothetical protein
MAHSFVVRAFLARHHPEVKAPEKITKENLLNLRLLVSL